MTRQRAEGLGTAHQAWLNRQKDGRGECTGVNQSLPEMGELVSPANEGTSRVRVSG